MKSWHVYIIRRGDGCLYTGMSTDPARRFSEHERGGPEAARYLKGRGPLALVYTVEAGDRSSAMRLEQTIKRLSRAAKIALIEDAAAAKESINSREEKSGIQPRKGRRIR